MKDRRRITTLLAAAAHAAVSLCLAAEAQSSPRQAAEEQTENSFVLRQVRVFDGEAVQDGVDVLVRDGVIAAVGTNVQAPEGVDRIDVAPGSTLLPAFLDAHTHNFLTSRSDALRFGVGTQIDMFTAAMTLPAARAQRGSLEPVTEADMWSAGTLVTAADGHGTQFGVPIPTLDAAADAEAFVEARVAEGSDFIKLVVEPGWSSPLPTLDRETVVATTAAAHALGKLAVVHVTSQEDAAMALDAGADGLAHLFVDAVASDELVAAFRERAAFVVPTLAVLESMAGRANGLAEDPRIAPYLAPHMTASLEQPIASDGAGRETILTNALESTRRLYEAGVPILAGSDAPNPGTAHGASLHRELELLVEAGLPPAAALAAATSAPADRFGIPDRGRVAEGKRADLVLVRGDPLADVTATREIIAVWKNGYAVERERFEAGAEPEADPPAALDDGVLGTFEVGDDGWTTTTDEVQGGRSRAELRADAGTLAVEARVEPGAPWPWAGVSRMLGAQWTETADLSDFEELVLRIRGADRIQVLFFSGSQLEGMSEPWPIELDPDWTEARIRLAAVSGLDRSRVRAIAVIAGPEPGAFRFEIDSAVLR